MATITAQGNVDRYGKAKITVTSDSSEELKITGEPGALVTAYREGIESGEGYMANAYYPEPGTMLQAYALACNLFGYRNVKVDGDIGTIPSEEGVVY